MLLSRYKAEGCTGTEAARLAGELLSARLARAEDIELLKMKASTEGSVQVIDEVEGEFDERLGEPVLSFSQLGLANVPVRKEIAEDHPRLLKRGFYANIELSDSRDNGSGSRFRVTALRPLGPSDTGLLPMCELVRKVSYPVC